MQIFTNTNIDFLGKNVILKSCGGPHVTVIDGGRAGRVAVRSWA